MINPYLQQRLFEIPLRPLLVETEPDAFDRVVNLFSNEGLRPHTVVSQFSLMGLPAIPSKFVESVNSLPGVRAVHADLMSSILLLPPFPALPLVGPRTGVFFAEDPSEWWPTSDSRRLLGAEQAFIDGFTGEAITLGIIDTGVDPGHEQLQGTQFDSTINFPREPGIDAGPQASGHGTHVASTAGGTQQLTPIQIFVEGVSRAPIFSVQALGRIIGTGFTSEIVNAISLAWERGARVFNLSLGASECQGTCTTCPECRVIAQLTARGGMFFIAAGNSGPNPNTIACPGCVPEAITVGAIDREGAVANFSSRGGTRFPTKPNIAAPGVNIYSGTGRGSQVDLGDPGASVGFAAISGTSMATPHAAGLGAILRQRFPGMSAEEFKDKMRTRGRFNQNTGFGVPTWGLFTGSGDPDPTVTNGRTGVLGIASGRFFPGGIPQRDPNQ